MIVCVDGIDGSSPAYGLWLCEAHMALVVHFELAQPLLKF
jgi:hypothetical protein